MSFANLIIKFFCVSSILFMLFDLVELREFRGLDKSKIANIILTLACII